MRTVQDKSDFFAEQLHGSMAGAGTNDRALIRIVCSRSEIDLGDIKNAYHRRYGQMLSESIHVRIYFTHSSIHTNIAKSGRLEQ